VTFSRVAGLGERQGASTIDYSTRGEPSQANAYGVDISRQEQQRTPEYTEHTEQEMKKHSGPAFRVFSVFRGLARTLQAISVHQRLFQRKTAFYPSAAPSVNAITKRA